MLPSTKPRPIDFYPQTEGNALFIVETVRAGMSDWKSETRDQAHNLRGALWAPVSSLQPLPPKVQAVIQQRLAQLSRSARDLACLAAAIGRSFTFALLNAASDTAESELVRNLDELWQRGIIRAQGSQAYDFSHDRIREVAYESISPMQRPLLHRRVAGRWNGSLPMTWIRSVRNWPCITSRRACLSRRSNTTGMRRRPQKGA